MLEIKIFPSSWRKVLICWWYYDYARIACRHLCNQPWLFATVVRPCVPCKMATQCCLLNLYMFHSSPLNSTPFYAPIIATERELATRKKKWLKIFLVCSFVLYESLFSRCHEWASSERNTNCMHWEYISVTVHSIECCNNESHESNQANKMQIFKLRFSCFILIDYTWIT